MRNRNLKTALLAGALALATTNLMAQGTEDASPGKSPPQPGSPGQDLKAKERAGALNDSMDLRASSIIGQAVRNDTGVRLGKVQDLIISMAAHTVPFAIVEYGGALGIGVTRVAVPLMDLKWSSEFNNLVLTATKADFESASTTPTGAWTSVSGEDWVRNVDRYYGQPSFSRYERQESNGMTDQREPVRNATDRLNPQPPAHLEAKDMAAPATGNYIAEKVNSVIHAGLGTQAADIQTSVKDGVVTLRGKVANEAQKQDLENKIKAVPGVTKVDDQLKVTEE